MPSIIKEPVPGDDTHTAPQRLPMWLWKQVRFMATEDHLSFNSEVIVLLKEAIQARKQRKLEDERQVASN